MRVLVLTRYGSLGASSRLRFYQYFDALGRLGIECEAHALFDDDYLRRKYAGRLPRPGRLLAGAAARVGRVLRDGDADVAWIEYEVLPWCPPALERRLAARLPPFVLEYDDAVFHRYDRHRSGIVRRVFGQKVPGLVRCASAVIVGNDYLHAFAERAGAVHVADVPSAVDLDRFPAPPPRTARREVVIGWIGSPSTAPYLAHLVPAWPMLRDRGLRLLVVGAGRALPPGLDAEVRDWDEAREAADLSDMDIGIMPLNAGPWEQGKSGYKLVQYMAAALPVVASPVGANRSIVVDGCTGLFASSPGEWIAALERLAGEPDLRARLGAEGRARCEAQYSVQAQAPRIARVLRGAAARG